MGLELGGLFILGIWIEKQGFRSQFCATGGMFSKGLRVDPDPLMGTWIVCAVSFAVTDVFPKGCEWIQIPSSSTETVFST